MTFLHLIVETVCKHPRISLIASLLFAAFFLAFAPLTKPLENVDFFFLKDHPDVKFYDNFKEIFGNDEFFVIAFEKEDIFTHKNLALIKDISEQLEGLEEIRKIKSLANVDDTIGEADYFELRKFIEEIPDSKNELKRLKDQAVDNPLYVKNIISPDARTAAILVQVYDRPDDEDYRKKLIEKVRRILNNYQKEVDKFYLAGWTTTNLTMAQFMIKDMETFVPITYLTLTFILLLFFRNIRLTLLALANIFLCTGSTMGLMGLTGITLNSVTSIITPLVMALALCDTVHIFSHMEKGILEKYPDKQKALACVLKDVVSPCFLTTLTTAIGFLSLTVSELRPIREFAWIASAGMVFEFIYSFFFLPPLILLFAPEKIYQEHHAGKGMTGVLDRINNLVQRHYRLIVIASCIIIPTACWFISKIRVETNPIEYFRKNSSVRNSIAFVDERLSGVGSMDISFKAKEKDAFKNPRNLKIIEEIQDYIKTLKGVDVTTSFVDFMKDMNESFHDEDPEYYRIPESRKLVSQYLLIYDSEDIDDFVNSTYDHARIAARLSEHGSAGQERLIRKIREHIEDMGHPGLDIRVTGWVIQNVVTIDTMVKGQVYSLSLAAGIISIIMFFVLRSLAIGCLSLIPNFFPIILNFGIMGAVGIPLNTATALIAAVALGIAVDDTIHFLSEYKRKREEGISVPDSLKLVTSVKGRAILSSSLILCVGFGVLVLSRFVPTVQFGMLCAIIMITAVIGDLVVLPSILLLKRQSTSILGRKQ